MDFIKSHRDAGSRVHRWSTKLHALSGPQNEPARLRRGQIHRSIRILDDNVAVPKQDPVLHNPLHQHLVKQALDLFVVGGLEAQRYRGKSHSLRHLQLR